VNWSGQAAGVTAWVSREELWLARSDETTRGREQYVIHQMCLRWGTLRTRARRARVGEAGAAPSARNVTQVAPGSGWRRIGGMLATQITGRSKDARHESGRKGGASYGRAYVGKAWKGAVGRLSWYWRVVEISGGSVDYRCDPSFKCQAPHSLAGSYSLREYQRGGGDLNSVLRRESITSSVLSPCPPRRLLRAP